MAYGKNRNQRFDISDLQFTDEANERRPYLTKLFDLLDEQRELVKKNPDVKLTKFPGIGGHATVETLLAQIEAVEVNIALLSKGETA